MAQWFRFEVLRRMEACGLVPTANAKTVDDYLRIAEALMRGGVPIIEILLRSGQMEIPRVHTDAIYELRKRHLGTNDLLVGCGTVHTAERAQTAIDAGAQFVVSNLVEEDVIKVVNTNGILAIPGAREDAQVRTALKLGCWVVKLFLPVPTLDPQANIVPMRQFRDIFPRAEFVPTGGITPENVGAFIREGYPFVVPSIVKSEYVAEKAWGKITDLARTFCSKVGEGRS